MTCNYILLANFFCHATNTARYNFMVQVQLSGKWGQNTVYEANHSMLVTTICPTVPTPTLFLCYLWTDNHVILCIVQVVYGPTGQQTTKVNHKRLSMSFRVDSGISVGTYTCHPSNAPACFEPLFSVIFTCI